MIHIDTSVETISVSTETTRPLHQQQATVFSKKTKKQNSPDKPTVYELLSDKQQMYNISDWLVNTAALLTRIKVKKWMRMLTEQYLKSDVAMVSSGTAGPQFANMSGISNL